MHPTHIAVALLPLIYVNEQRPKIKKMINFLFFDSCLVITSKLGVPIKTTISTSVLEEAINGTVTIRPLPLGRTVHDRVD